MTVKKSKQNPQNPLPYLGAGLFCLAIGVIVGAFAVAADPKQSPHVLHKLMKIAEREENYELAAFYRDQLKSIKNHEQTPNKI